MKEDNFKVNSIIDETITNNYMKLAITKASKYGLKVLEIEPVEYHIINGEILSIRYRLETEMITVKGTTNITVTNKEVRKKYEVI